MKLQYKRFPLEIKSLKERQFEGYLSTFGNVDHGGDIVARGAFKRTLKDYKSKGELPPMFWMHDASRVPGKWLEMSEDDAGLYVKGELAPTPLGEEMRVLLGMKAVRGMSIGYSVEDRDWDKEGHRILKDIELWEGSIVSLAMNPLAQITAAKSRLSAKGEYVPQAAEFKRRLEAHLRDEGISWTLAKAMVANLLDDTSAMVDLSDVDLRDGDDASDADAKALKEALRELEVTMALAAGR
jgi:HK97 family phage prohead protease